MDFIVTHEVEPRKWCPVIPMPPKLDIIEAATAALSFGVIDLLVTDELRAEHRARFELAITKPQQRYGRTDDQIYVHEWHGLADYAASMIPGFEQNPDFVAKGWRYDDKTTQVPDVVHSASGTQFEVKTLRDGLDTYTMYVETASHIFARPERVDYFLLGRAKMIWRPVPGHRPTVEVYRFKPMCVFLRSSLFHAENGMPTNYVKSEMTRKGSRWKYLHTMAEADGHCITSDPGPIT